MKKLSLVLFDVDGVLLDSLRPHLRICEDKNREYGLGLKIPDAQEFKTMARRGIRISPMKEFFIAVGFPEQFAEKANKQYQEIFMRRYAPAPFPHVYSLLRSLHDAGLWLGIVTSNVKANIDEALGPSMRFFRPECIYTDDEVAGAAKSDAITSAMRKMQVPPSETIYVGDQRSDWAAARAANVNFLGVAYGWGISEDDTEFPIARDVSDVRKYLSERARCLA